MQGDVHIAVDNIGGLTVTGNSEPLAVSGGHDLFLPRYYCFKAGVEYNDFYFGMRMFILKCGFLFACELLSLGRGEM